MNLRNKQVILCFIFMLLSIIGFVLIDLTTINPVHYSGNGNFAILFTIPTVPLYLIFLYLLGRLVYKGSKRMTAKRYFYLLGILLMVTIILIFLEIRFIKQLMYLLGGGPEIPESRIFRFGWYNQYTNTFYFNWITFCLGMVFSTVLSSSVARLKR
jgi:phosphoglycerol transferase MdoB-like AlkP superfamily enzyme